jgi:hypothetical protein
MGLLMLSDQAERNLGSMKWRGGDAIGMTLQPQRRFNMTFS